MQTTPLTETHRALGAKLVDFAGFEMPLTYSGLKEEHAAVRNGVGMFDVSHMGEFIVRGPGARDLVQYVTSNDVDRLAEGQAQYSCLPRPAGGIVDDLLVYRLPANPAMGAGDGHPSYLLVVNAGNIRKDWDWISAHNRFGAEMIDISSTTALLAVQGPKATDVLQKLTTQKLADIPYYHFVRGDFAGLDNVILSATGYTGAGGFELYFDAKDAEAVWNAIMAAGQDAGILPCGLGARDTLRLEKGFCLYGNDINDETTPLEAGLGWITKLAAGDFLGRDHLLAQKEAGLARRLVGFTVDGRRAPRQGHPLTDEDGNVIGEVTSGTHSPTLDLPIGLGYVKSGFHQPGTRIQIDLGRKFAEATVVKIPFL
ncbi:glycine cleavage system aminomethyltransferase GcvT [Neolewinella lacunae]|uniref:Aminomethyltransferase n=1 Tax=Neolewinella lacunae TaxID=1517758 RepID=A0A923PMA9_9BACT|nr:glycine cleavage system aminomethyltransferase GcvT [Neolewinella lacunae]MBC6993798.1 glycine cleavage system aminomethyltransferase GcvT [Neolewinella lacunae]MDN3635311.1 glycine cleavage system aminomethyltransferase GcvT [Neolewinella lacunae]